MDSKNFFARNGETGAAHNFNASSTRPSVPFNATIQPIPATGLRKKPIFII